MHLGDIIKNQKFCQSQTFGILTHNVDTSVCGILQKKHTLISGVDKFEAAESVVVVGADVGLGVVVGADVGLGVVVGSGPATI